MDTPERLHRATLLQLADLGSNISCIQNFFLQGRLTNDVDPDFLLLHEHPCRQEPLLRRIILAMSPATAEYQTRALWPGWVELMHKRGVDVQHTTRMPSDGDIIYRDITLSQTVGSTELQGMGSLWALTDLWENLPGPSRLLNFRLTYDHTTDSRGLYKILVAGWDGMTSNVAPHCLFAPLQEAEAVFIVSRQHPVKLANFTLHIDIG